MDHQISLSMVVRRQRDVWTTYSQCEYRRIRRVSSCKFKRIERIRGCYSLYPQDIIIINRAFFSSSEKRKRSIGYRVSGNRVLEDQRYSCVVRSHRNRNTVADTQGCRCVHPPADTVREEQQEFGMLLNHFRSAYVRILVCQLHP